MADGSTAGERRLYEIRVEGLEHLHDPLRKVIFHGVNKSGSLVLSDVLRGAYFAAGRANQFFSHYRGVPRDFDYLIQLIQHTTQPAFFVAHNLYGTYAVDHATQLLATQFRNPLPRVLSCYHWLRRKAVHKEAPFPSFEEWVVNTRGLAHSQVTQFATGYNAAELARRKSMTGDQLLEAALAHIDTDVAWFGIAEQFEESIWCVAALCGLTQVPAWTTDERNVGRPLVDDVPRAHLDLIRQVYHWDFLLYEHVSALFKRRLAGLRLGGDIDAYRLDCAGSYKDRLGPDGRPLAGA